MITRLQHLSDLFVIARARRKIRRRARRKFRAARWERDHARANRRRGLRVQPIGQTDHGHSYSGDAVTAIRQMRELQQQMERDGSGKLLLAAAQLDKYLRVLEGRSIP